MIPHRFSRWSPQACKETGCMAGFAAEWEQRTKIAALAPKVPPDGLYTPPGLMPEVPYSGLRPWATGPRPCLAWFPSFSARKETVGNGQV